MWCAIFTPELGRTAGFEDKAAAAQDRAAVDLQKADNAKTDAMLKDEAAEIGGR
jgi:hypothetical protein